MEKLRALPGVEKTAVLAPVMPVLGRKQISVPFITCEEMVKIAGDKPLWQLAIDYESARSGDSEAEVYAKMEKLLSVMRAAIAHGLAGTEYEDRILPCQSGNFSKQREAGKLLLKMRDGATLPVSRSFAKPVRQVLNERDADRRLSGGAH